MSKKKEIQYLVKRGYSYLKELDAYMTALTAVLNEIDLLYSPKMTKKQRDEILKDLGLRK